MTSVAVTSKEEDKMSSVQIKVPPLPDRATGPVPSPAPDPPPPTQVNSTGVKSSLELRTSTHAPSGEAFPVAWTKIDDGIRSDQQHLRIQPRHGHRAVFYESFMIVFGGGNEGLATELFVFDIESKEWFQPNVQGEAPPGGRAAFGVVMDGARIIMHGGMKEHCILSNDMHELNVKTWTWKKMNPIGPRNNELPPYPRLGHSFTLIRDSVFLFGGLTSQTNECGTMYLYPYPRYLNDLYTLHVKENNGDGVWGIPTTFGSPPSPRESHSAVAYSTKDGRHNKLIIYGGMCGVRRADLFFLDVDTMMWCRPEILGVAPLPRSLHTAAVVGEKMYIFGGWIPMYYKDLNNNNADWQCTNTLACLNIQTLTWECIKCISQEDSEDKGPRPRAGHSVAVGTKDNRIYIWSGRDGYKTNFDKSQRCFTDLWQLDVQKPGAPGKVQLVKGGKNWLHVSWGAVPGADSYILQCCVHRDVPRTHPPIPNQSLGPKLLPPTGETETTTSTRTPAINVDLPMNTNSNLTGDMWMDVIHTKATTTTVRSYFTTNERLSKIKADTLVDRDMEFIKQNVCLKEGTVYKLRLAAINSCGRGPWGEVAGYKTYIPGFPGAPNSVKIANYREGVHVTWKPPSSKVQDITEYSVFLAMKTSPNECGSQNNFTAGSISNLSFWKVYSGILNNCVISSDLIAKAMVDTTSQPAILFRIAAKNERGYGPSTQVRWLQEGRNEPARPIMGTMKRASSSSTLPSPDPDTAAKRRCEEK